MPYASIHYHACAFPVLDTHLFGFLTTVQHNPKKKKSDSVKHQSTENAIPRSDAAPGVCDGAPPPAVNRTSMFLVPLVLLRSPDMYHAVPAAAAAAAAAPPRTRLRMLDAILGLRF